MRKKNSSESLNIIYLGLFDCYTYISVFIQMNMLSSYICMYEHRPYYMNTDAMSSFHFILWITYQSIREKKPK